MSIRNEMNQHAFENFSKLPDDAYVSLAVLILLFGVSKSTIQRYIKKGIIPAPHKLSEKTTRWKVGELRTVTFN